MGATGRIEDYYPRFIKIRTRVSKHPPKGRVLKLMVILPCIFQSIYLWQSLNTPEEEDGTPISGGCYECQFEHCGC